ncbi:hypothetical protein [Clostridium sp. ZS2-4]|uniref:hypothetical protein n=1 Tax=Clostridium sp. ZS2-4 TaxID=2987703 RepID=UPI00227AD85A|nr:hypothetical protein [Clostridium sp. ZS2-4]MCY6355973.1 hypothetical protein [Clostridium sp. ZS2-4]
MTALIFIVSLIKIRIYLPVLSKNNELLRMCEKAIVINNVVIVSVCILCSIIILKKKHKQM